jgi:hypothetical protein
MPKFKVKFDFHDYLIIEAEDEEIAIEKFMEQFEDVIAQNNETIENRVWDSVKATKISKN